MKTVITTYWKVFASLLVIFLSGSGFGYYAACSAKSDIPAALPATAKTVDWPERTMEKLREVLELTDEQVRQIEPHIAGVGEKVFQERDRALLQISLQVLEVHDSIEPYLDENQKNNLAKSRKSMQLHIEKRFSSLIKN